MCGPLFKMSHENDAHSWSFVFYVFHHLCVLPVLTDKKELRLGQKTTHSIGQQRWEESHAQWDIACMPRKERMLQLEGNAVFAVPCKHCLEATHRFAPGDTSVCFTCPFSIYAINRSNATCIPEILNAVRWNTALVFFDGHLSGILSQEFTELVLDVLSSTGKSIAGTVPRMSLLVDAVVSSASRAESRKSEHSRK